MAKSALRKGDLVVVKTGKDKGKQGKILKVLPEANRVIVERINFRKEFVRADRSRNVQGGIMEKEAPIHVSNVMVFCAECGQPVRVKTKVLEDGSRTRTCAKCELVLEKAK